MAEHEAERRLYALMDANGIAHHTHEHPPVFTVEEARAHTAHLPGAHCKNLFFKDKKGGLWLVSCFDDQLVRPNPLAKRLAAPRLSFGKPDLLMATLGVAPGAVTPYGLINDAARLVNVVFDQKMIASPLVNFHPMRNDATTAIAGADLLRFVESLGYAPTVFDLDQAIEPPSP